MTAKSRKRKLEKKAKTKPLICSDNPRYSFKTSEGRTVEVVAPSRALAVEHFKSQYGYFPAAE